MTQHVSLGYTGHGISSLCWKSVIFLHIFSLTSWAMVTQGLLCYLGMSLTLKAVVLTNRWDENWALWGFISVPLLSLPLNWRWF